MYENTSGEGNSHPTRIQERRLPILCVLLCPTVKLLIQKFLTESRTTVRETEKSTQETTSTGVPFVDTNQSLDPKVRL